MRKWLQCGALMAAAAGTLMAAGGADLELIVPPRDAQLAAILRLPAGRPPYPAVVLVHGSGRQTGSGQMQSGGQRLVDMGFAVLAYDCQCSVARSASTAGR